MDRLVLLSVGMGTRTTHLIPELGRVSHTFLSAPLSVSAIRVRGREGRYLKTSSGLR